MNVSSIGSYVMRGIKMYPDFVLGTGNEAFTKALKETVKNRGSQGYFSSVWQGTKKGFLASEEHNAKMLERDGNFWKSTWKALKTTPHKISQGWKVGGQLAQKAGKTGLSKYWAQTKGALSGLGKRMPLIGTLMVAVTELPNIYSAFKDLGFLGGVKEVGKTGLRLGAGMTGAAIGQALIPIPGIGALIGGLVGYMVGDGLMSKVVGKSYSEKKAEAEEQQQQAMAQAMQQQGMQMPQVGQNSEAGQLAQNTTIPQMNIPTPTIAPQQLMAMQQQLYGSSGAMNDDFMANMSGMNSNPFGKLNYTC